RRLLAEFPGLRADAGTGAVRYYDAQVDDARFVVSLARTAAAYGAAVLTSARVTGLLRDGERVVGVRVRDLEGRRGYDVRARAVVGAHGGGSDSMRGRLESGQTAARA